MDESQDSGTNRDRDPRGEFLTAVRLRMAGAVAHQRVSVHCDDRAFTDMDIVDSMYVRWLSFSLVLFSVEQSLKLMLLLHFNYWSKRERHDLFRLYKAISRHSDTAFKNSKSDCITLSIVDKVNAVIEEVNEHDSTSGIKWFKPVTQAELLTCVEQNRKLYSDLRYFMLSLDSKLKSSIGYSLRTFEIINFLAEALIDLNEDAIGRHNLFVLAYADRIGKGELYKHLVRRQISMDFDYDA